MCFMNGIAYIKFLQKKKSSASFASLKSSISRTLEFEVIQIRVAYSKVRELNHD